MTNDSDRLKGIGACVFDAYGTLFDVNASANRCRADLGTHAEPALLRRRLAHRPDAVT